MHLGQCVKQQKLCVPMATIIATHGSHQQCWLIGTCRQIIIAETSNWAKSSSQSAQKRPPSLLEWNHRPKVIPIPSKFYNVHKSGKPKCRPHISDAESAPIPSSSTLMLLESRQNFLSRAALKNLLLGNSAVEHRVLIPKVQIFQIIKRTIFGLLMSSNIATRALS